MSFVSGQDPAAIQGLIKAWEHQQGNFKFQTASYALYCWDHLLVFDDEVEKIWRRKFTFASLLYVLNRYITHVQFIAIQVGFYETTWSAEQCDAFVKFPGAGTITVFAIAKMTMILRMYASYRRNNWVLYFLCIVLVAQVTIMSICLGTGARVKFPPGFPGCVLTGTVSYFGAFWIAPLVTDSCIFALTLFRTWRYRKSRLNVPIAEQMFRDGILYFLVIFFGNLLNVILYWSAPPDLTALGASFTHVMTSLMVARLHLNLRSAINESNGAYHPSHSSIGNDVGRRRQAYAGNQSFFTLGNLGEEMEASSYSSAKYGLGGKGRPVQHDSSREGFDIPLQTLQPRSRSEALV